MPRISLMRVRACSRLVFNRMLGLNLTYIAAGTFVEMYMALRAGECDVGITAVEMCVARAAAQGSLPLRAALLTPQARACAQGPGAHDLLEHVPGAAFCAA
jgi:hypothetical protein